MSNIVKGSGIIYTTGIPNTIPAVGTDAEFAISTTGIQYAWNRSTNVWDNLGQGIEIATSSIVPTHTPTNFRPRFVATPSRDLYYYSGSWGKIAALPSGVISSSAQLSRTGIYSGSNNLNQSVVVNNLGTFGFQIGDTQQAAFGNGLFLDAGGGTTIGDMFQAGKSYITMTPTDDAMDISLPTVGTLRFNGVDGKALFIDNRVLPIGIEYGDDYSETIKDERRSIPDVGTIETQLTSSYSLTAFNGNKYKTVSMTIAQAGTDDPTLVQLLRDDWNDIYTFERIVTGNYKINSTNANFTTNTFIFTAQALSNNDAWYIRGFRAADEYVTIESFNVAGSYTDLDTDLPLYVEIRTYE